MKNLILIIAAVFSFSISASASNIGGKATILTSEKVVLSVDKPADYIKSSTYNSDSEDIALVFKSVVSTVQIYNDKNEMVMTFPAGTDQLNLGLTLFESGLYKVGFLIEGQNEFQFTNLIVK